MHWQPHQETAMSKSTYGSYPPSNKLESSRYSMVTYSSTGSDDSSSQFRSKLECCLGWSFCSAKNNYDVILILHHIKYSSCRVDDFELIHEHYDAILILHHKIFLLQSRWLWTYSWTLWCKLLHNRLWCHRWWCGWGEWWWQWQRMKVFQQWLAAGTVMTSII